MFFFAPPPPQHRCLEQRSKPHCITDPYTNKCRCPRCDDQKERAWCKKHTVAPTTMSSASKLLMHDIKNCMSSQLDAAAFVTFF